MKYKYMYANRLFFFLHLISSFIWFCSIYTENNFGRYRQLIVFCFFFLVVFLDKDVIYLTVKSDNKDFSLWYIGVE